MSLSRDITGCLTTVGGRTFVVVPGNNLSEDGVSLNDPLNGLFLRHCQGRLREDPLPQTPDELFAFDSSFIPVPVSRGILLRCSNPGFQSLYLAKADLSLMIGPRSLALELPLLRGLFPGETVNLEGVLHQICPASIPHTGGKEKELNRHEGMISLPDGCQLPFAGGAQGVHSGAVTLVRVYDGKALCRSGNRLCHRRTGLLARLGGVRKGMFVPVIWDGGYALMEVTDSGKPGVADLLVTCHPGADGSALALAPVFTPAPGGSKDRQSAPDSDPGTATDAGPRPSFQKRADPDRCSGDPVSAPAAGAASVLDATSASGTRKGSSIPGFGETVPAARAARLHPVMHWGPAYLTAGMAGKGTWIRDAAGGSPSSCARSGGVPGAVVPDRTPEELLRLSSRLARLESRIFLDWKMSAATGAAPVTVQAASPETVPAAIRDPAPDSAPACGSPLCVNEGVSPAEPAGTPDRDKLRAGSLARSGTVPPVPSCFPRLLSPGDLPLVSVVLPVFNGELSLKECLVSLLAQSLRETEIICVDDGSGDGSRGILECFAARDPRIRLFRQEHLGAATARDQGLARIRGKLVCFLEPDAVYSPDMLLLLCARAAEHDLDVAVCRSRELRNSRTVSTDWEEAEAEESLPSCGVFTPADIASRIFQAFSGRTWDKLFAARFLRRHSMLFQDAACPDDEAFTYRALCLAGHIGLVAEKLTFHRCPGLSAVARRKLTPLAFLEVFTWLDRWLRKEGLVDLFGCSFRNWAVSYSRQQMKTVCLPDPDQSERVEETVITSLRGLMADQLEAVCREPVYQEEDAEWVYLRILNNRPAVTVIIPLYNCRAYVLDTLRSVADQTFPSFEAICVDDGSTDGSADVVAEFVRTDPRFTLVRQENRGAAAARNRGLELARGEYVAFLDADDLWCPDFLRKTFLRAKSQDLDIVMTRYLRFRDEDGVVELPGNDICLSQLPEGSRFSPAEVRDRLFQMFIPVVWNKLFRRSLVIKENLRFQDLRNTNDTFFMYSAFLTAGWIGALDARLVKYRIRSGSLVRSKDQAPFCFLEALRAIYGRILSLGSPWQEEILSSFRERVIRNTIWNMRQVAPEIRPEMLSRAEAFLRETGAGDELQSRFKQQSGEITASGSPRD